ncbi:CamS family sex pheromone protein [Heyndrickxia sp. NPDC080065]|uniref:CamS family sex pheromone protein n=1 Tax=Heyndrickxia sp. NPDC080065 TaxID=3390568 RepID=UPI003D00D85A
MKKWLPVFASVLLLITGCAPKFDSQDKIVQDKNNNNKKQTAIIPTYQVSDEYYRTLIPFEPSKARGRIVNNLNTRYDIQEFETGLMRVAQKSFSPDTYLFQEGQYLDKDTVDAWLNRKYTSSQLKEKKLTSADNLGLNPVNDGKGSIEEQNKKAPIYLAHILEHDYLVKSKKGNTAKLGGVVIGLALNTVHYYQKEQYGAVYEEDIKNTESEGKKIAQEVIKRLRNMNGLKDVPITIALFEQKAKDSVVPGNFVSYAEVGQGSSSIDKWKKIDEKYYLFPDDTTTKDYRDDANKFDKFKQNIEEYFPNYNGVIGRGLYRDKQLSQLSVEIPIQFYGQAEVIGFTQYLTGQVIQTFPDYISLEVSITSVNGPKAIIVREPGEKEPFVHIYQ